MSSRSKQEREILLTTLFLGSQTMSMKDWLYYTRTLVATLFKRGKKTLPLFVSLWCSVKTVSPNERAHEKKEKSKNQLIVTIAIFAKTFLSSYFSLSFFYFFQLQFPLKENKVRKKSDHLFLRHAPTTFFAVIYNPPLANLCMLHFWMASSFIHLSINGQSEGEREWLSDSITWVWLTDRLRGGHCKTTGYCLFLILIWNSI